MDLTELVGFDLDAARASIQAVRPGMEILEVSAKTEDGMNSWIEAIISRHQEPSLNERKLTTTFIT